MRSRRCARRRARGGDYLYDLPWYIIIGPPGAGKTTALVNSGLKFPLARGGTPEAVAGVGGTRYCDWWFTEEAVLIDTAGRYTTQDSDAKGDRKSWLAFLDLLQDATGRSSRSTACIVAISLEDLLTLAAERDQRACRRDPHAPDRAARAAEGRLPGLCAVHQGRPRRRLHASISATCTEAERRMVWGATFQTDDKTRNMIGEVPAEFDALIERLNEQLPDRLQDEPTHDRARASLFGFPSQMAALKQPDRSTSSTASSSRRATTPTPRCAASTSPPARSRARRSTS